MNSKLKLSLLAGALAPVAPLFTLTAQESSEVMDLDTFMVTTNRYYQDASIVPSTSLVLDRAVIENTVSINLPELLQKESAGIQWRNFNGDSMWAQPAMRGYGENSQMRVLLLVDGVRMNRPDMGAFNWSEIPMADIASIEVIPGSHSVIYGSNAVSGVIKINTRKPADDLESAVSATFGSYGLQDIWGYSSETINHTGVSVTLERYRNDGYRDFSENESDSVNLGVRHQWKDWDFNVRATYVDSTSELPGPIYGDPWANDPRSAPNSSGTFDSDYYSVAADIVRDANRAVSIEIESGYTYRDIASDSSWSSTDTEFNSYQLAPRVIWDNGTVKTIVGIDTQLNEVESDIYTDATRSYHNGKVDLDQTNAGIYAHTVYTLNKQWIFSAGLRGEYSKLDATTHTYNPFGYAGVPDVTTADSDKSDNGWAMNAGVTFKPTETVRTWLRVDHLYRYAATDEVVSYYGYSMSSWFNDHLDPEEGWNVELGGEWEATKDLNFHLNVYYQDMDGEIAYDPITWSNINFPGTRRYGLDTGVRYYWQNWEFKADYSYVDAEFTAGTFDGYDIYLVSPHTVSLRVSWAPIKCVRIEAGWRYNSSAWEGNDFTNSADKLPAYDLVDVSVRWNVNEDFSVFGNVDNLLDEEYATMKYSGGWYPSPGSTVRGGVKYTF